MGELNLHIGLNSKTIPVKLTLDHSQLLKYQKGLKIANLVTQILLRWTAQANFAGIFILDPWKKLRNVRGNMLFLMYAAGEVTRCLDTSSEKSIAAATKSILRSTNRQDHKLKKNV